jgi:Rod binding domain-containing protein
MLPKIDTRLMEMSLDKSKTQSTIDVEKLKRAPGSEESKIEKLKEACEGFEAIFMGKLLKDMRKTVPENEFLHSKEEKMYLSMFDSEIAKKLASAGGMGIGNMLFTHLKSSLMQAGGETNSPTKPLPVRPLRPEGFAMGDEVKPKAENVVKEAVMPDPDPSVMAEVDTLAERIMRARKGDGES